MSTATDSVLLVDDEKSILDVLSLGFKKGGLAVEAVASVEEALERLEAARYGAVVTDKNMPGKSGLELLKVVGEKHPHCARIVITGYVNTDSVLEALRLGADDYLVKPFESIMLVVERVKKAMRHHRTQLEREALAERLREMEKTLRRSESTAFQKGTELDLFQNVFELQLEDATRALRERVATLEAQVASELERRVGVKRTLVELAAQAGGDVGRRLLAESELLDD
jgi:DNA-binding NtrC family response regulator